MGTKKDGRGIYAHLFYFIYLFIRHKIKDMDDGMDDKGESCIEKDGKGVWLHIEVVLKDKKGMMVNNKEIKELNGK
jgi:hypothetical protein